MRPNARVGVTGEGSGLKFTVKGVGSVSRVMAGAKGLALGCQVLGENMVRLRAYARVWLCVSVCASGDGALV